MKKDYVKKEAYDSLPIQQAIIYINKHFSEKITLKQLAKILSFSPNYLGYLFKTQLGISFTEYLNNMRLNYACGLLQSSDFLVKEIAFLSGFNSVTYFVQLFKRKMEMTPKEYKKKFN